MTDALARLTTALVERYRIERELGAGGMATVYLAHDVKHDRKVALKVLRPELSAILGAERFLAEIKTTANLQHPHILSLFDSGEADGLVFYVMPFVEGESLRDRLTRERQLPVDDAVRIAREVAGALDYAHRHGVVHRDIKPENILLHDGSALVADFGIALAVSRSDGGTRMTETGMSLGTPHYMSPEQAMGEKEITPKADVYALGCVLYEMLAGEPPFTGPTAQAIIARVMTEEPRSLTLQRRTIPPNVDATVVRALEKLPADRFASAAQFAEALDSPAFRGRTGTRVPAAAEPRAEGVIGVRTLVRRPWVATVATGVILGVLGLLAGMRLARPRAEPPRPVRFTLALPDSARYVDTFGRSIAIAPDGSALVYSGGTPARRQLWLRRLDEPRPTPIDGTEGAYMPFYSPDGAWLGFVANQRLMKVRLAGGSPITIAQLLGNTVSGASWGAHDVIVLEDVSGLSRVNAAGGRLEVLTSLDSTNRLVEWPTFLPDGEALLCAVTRNDATYLGLVRLGDGRVTVFDDFEGSDPRFIAPGTVVWTTREGVVLAAPFDARRRRFTGTPIAVLEGVLSDGGAAKIGIGPRLAVRVEGGQQRSQLLRLDRHGVARPERSELMNYLLPRFSPNARRIVVVTGLNEGIGVQGELWVLDRARGTRQRLTLGYAVAAAEWSPDGQRLAFAYLPGASWDVYAAPADGSGAADSLVGGPGTDMPGGWAPDGSFIFWRQTQNRGDIMVRGPNGVERAFAATAANELTPTLSPDGRWLAFVSDESGRREVYVRPFPTGEGRWQISSDGGIEPRWSKNGREIVFRSGDWFLAVPVTAGPGISTGAADSLFHGPYSTTALRTQYDVSRDGSEFIIVGAPAANRTLAVTLDPFDGLRRPGPRAASP